MRWRGEPALRRKVAVFIALAALIQAGETLIPVPLPWFRLGLGNAFALAAFVLWGMRAGAFVGLGKVFAGAMLTGKLLTPGFILSFGGSAASVAVVWAALFVRLPLGFVGLSVLGAASHALAQLFLAEKVVLKTEAVWALLPYLGSLSVVSGIVTGLAAAWVYDAALIQEETEGL